MTHHYPEQFPADLQEAAEAARKELDPSTMTEDEIQQIWELWQAESTPCLVDFVQRL